MNVKKNVKLALLLINIHLLSYLCCLHLARQGKQQKVFLVAVQRAASTTVHPTQAMLTKQNCKIPYR